MAITCSSLIASVSTHSLSNRITSNVMFRRVLKLESRDGVVGVAPEHRLSHPSSIWLLVIAFPFSLYRITFNRGVPTP